MNKVISGLLWQAQKIAFALRLYRLGAAAVNGACAARNRGGFDWHNYRWP